MAVGRGMKPWMTPRRGFKDRNDLAMKNRGLLYQTINRFFSYYPSYGYRYDRDDAEADATIGLLRAAELFDETKGNAFGTYAVPWMWAAMQRGQDLNKIVRTGTKNKNVGVNVYLFSTMGENLDDAAHSWNLVDSKQDTMKDVSRNERQQAVRDAMRVIPSRWRSVLQMRYFEYKPLEEVGKALKISCERVRQLETKAIQRLDKELRRKGWNSQQLKG